jgi:hypothetical protein
MPYRIRDAIASCTPSYALIFPLSTQKSVSGKPLSSRFFSKPDEERRKKAAWKYGPSFFLFLHGFERAAAGVYNGLG